MRLALTAILITLTCTVAPARAIDSPQAPLHGRVTDAASGKPVMNAVVTLAGFPGTVKTDADGAFTWPAAPAPPFQVVIVLPGGQVARPVEITRLDEAILRIRVDALATETITVLGAAPSITAAPAAGTSLLSSAQIARRTPENLMQALETVPGVTAVSEGHATVPAIRGLARGRTLVLIDGARVTSERRVGPSATYADPATFEGIDVARGPGSVAYGSDAIGGVISVRTRRAQPGSPLAISGTATLGAGIPEGRGTVEVSKGLDRGGVFVQAHARSARDWNSPAGPGDVFNSGWRDQGFNGRVDYEIGRGLFSAGWQSDFGRDIERPRNNSRTVRFYYPYEDSHRLTSSYEIADVAGLQQLAVTGFVGAFEQRTDQDRAATSSSVRNIERADVSARDFHVKASGRQQAGRASLEFGLDVNGRFDLRASESTITYRPDGTIGARADNLVVDGARRTAAGAYLQADAAVNPTLRVSGGARLDRVTTANRGGYFGNRSTVNGAASGFGSVTVGPFSGFSVTGQVARGFRDPTLSDRYFRGPSGRGYITGNPDLGPETSLQFDLAARYTIGATQLAAYAYHYRINDIVERYSTESDFFFFRNRGRARVRGVELEARTEMGRGIALEGGVNVGRGVALDDGAPLDDIAPDTVFAVVRKNWNTRAYGQVRASFTVDDDRAGPSEIASPGAQVIDLSAGWRFTPAIEMRGIVRNLLDDAYYASPDPRWVYAPGRSGSLTLAFEF
jgi:outer membrane receptor protein involved in Fe transport